MTKLWILFNKLLNIGRKLFKTYHSQLFELFHNLLNICLLFDHSKHRLNLNIWLTYLFIQINKVYKTSWWIILLVIFYLTYHLLFWINITSIYIIWETLLNIFIVLTIEYNTSYFIWEKHWLEYILNSIDIRFMANNNNFFIVFIVLLFFNIVYCWDKLYFDLWITLQLLGLKLEFFNIFNDPNVSGLLIQRFLYYFWFFDNRQRVRIILVITVFVFVIFIAWTKVLRYH